MNKLSRILAWFLCLVLFETIAVASVLSQQEAKPEKHGAKAKQESKEKEEDCGCDAKPPADVAGVVNGAKINFKDVDEPIKSRIEDLQKQIVDGRRNELERLINEHLLRGEAKRRGVALEALESETAKRAQEPGEADARTYYDQNKDQIQGDFDDVKENIIGFLRSQRQQSEIKKEADRLRVGGQVRVVTPNPAAPQTAADRAKVLATVNGQSITSANIEDAFKPILFDLKQQIYALRKQSLDAKINSMLLDEEARKRNLTPQSIFETEVEALMQPVKESEARKFYEENRDRIQGGYVQVREQIIQYLESQEQTRAAAAFADKLRSSAKIQTYLTQPESPYFEIAVDDQPWKGNADAPVTIVEFTDFQCPSCGNTHPIIQQVVKEMGDKVKLVVRDYPLDQHTYAEKAAEAAEAARAQGKYWEYAELLFQNQKELSVEKLKEYASQLGLDRARFDKELDSGQHAEAVKRDLRDGNSAGVNSTPSIFVNGRKVQDRTAEGLKAAVEAALKTAGSKETPKKSETSQK